MTKKPNYFPRKSTKDAERTPMRVELKTVPHGRYARGKVTDLNTGRVYLVRTASCGLNCFCDAVIVKEIS